MYNKLEYSSNNSNSQCSHNFNEKLGDYDKKFAVVNPTRMCQPMGAIQAMMGVKNAMPLIHGSQGCATYMRFQLIRHFREPIEVASTSLSEKTVIYGGEPNLLKALKNISEKQNPSMICVMSSCLTDTIGDDIAGIIEKFQDANIGIDLPEMVPISTPSYAGSHVEGYDKAILSLVEHFGIFSVPNSKINLIMGDLSPANVMEIKNLMNDLGCESIILTDTSKNLDAPLDEETLELHKYGTTMEELKDTPNSKATIALSKHVDSAGKYLECNFNVKSISGPLPVGIKNTDEFVNNICNVMGIDVPDSVERDRGRLKDVLVDAHAYNYRKKVAIYGDPDVVIAMARMVSEMGMLPEVLCVGVESPRFKEDVNELVNDINYQPVVLENKDLYDLEQVLSVNKVDLLIGNAYGASIAKKENIPLFRIGFPIFDRIGSQRISFLGYNGGIKFVDAITNMILDNYYDAEGYKIVEEEFSLDLVDEELS
ncbi:nitrogenase molybdenum-iron protein beta chain [Methanobrevibacter cuticularis]|uniref:Nitrogenase molybdenum-iron protein beta chain n=1 Tax=Methanobrevibacter cuticularis TaxID=47311 RepID=A0A166DFT6_9EURY|nr:nitrogenase component 1 [Methanobrevibacter cuticularis]KZX15556.1 nitrogenase molybdenum-iron protein beta chain [Methanobrevibacter cuticularis]